MGDDRAGRSVWWWILPLAFVLFVALADLAGVVYWDAAVRSNLEKVRKPPWDANADRFLEEAGIRTVRPLVREMDRAETSGDRAGLARATEDLIRYGVVFEREVYHSVAPIMHVDYLGNPYDPVLLTDPPYEAKYKCDELRRRWAEVSGRHPVWKFWDDGRLK